MYSVIDLTSGAVPRPAVLRPSDIPVPLNPATARLGGHRFTGSLAADILARRPLPARPKPAALPPVRAPPVPKPQKLGGYFGARGKPRKVSKNQLHGRGSGYVYKRRGARKRFFDSAGSYSAGPKKKKSKSSTSSRTRAPRTRAKKAGGKTSTARRRKRVATGADKARTTAELVRIASVLRQSSEARLRKISASAKRAEAERLRR